MHPDLKYKFLRLEEKKNFYANILETYSEKQLNFSLFEDEWSLVKVIDHLIKVENQTFQFMKNFDFSRKNEKLGFKAAINSFLLKIALKSSIKFQVPSKAVIPEAKNQQILLSEWQYLRMELGRFLDSFPENKTANFIFFHPRSGKLNINQTLDFLIIHMHHHLPQVKKISNSTNFPTTTEI